MKRELGLRVLGDIMGWDDEKANAEFDWLDLMARLKYDGYGDFQAGMRFVESLANWLQQFEQDEREIAYSFVRKDLVYVGPGESQRLVEQFYPRFVQTRLVSMVAHELGIAPYLAFSTEAALNALKRLGRQTLFLALSDGARVDVLRHSNVGRISNEQLAASSQLHRDKWDDQLESLRKDLDDTEARFRLVYLIDDFTGTGTSFLRWDEKKGRWAGKLWRFRELLAHEEGLIDSFFEPGWELCAHHYLASHRAATDLGTRVEEAQAALALEGWPTGVPLSFGAVFPKDLPLQRGRDDAFMSLAAKNYDPAIQTEHTEVGGVKRIDLGYGACALPLVLEHNTPNNSVALLWAESDGDDAGVPAMRPLFRRRQRHV